MLSATSIAAIRASLDSGVVKEMQKLNRLMVVLTIAISGGPFLGLLGNCRRRHDHLRGDRRLGRR